MGLRVHVYRAADRVDCTNGGASSRVTSFILVNVEGPFEPSEDSPAAFLRKGYVPGAVIVVPADIPETKHTMFGGNFVYSSDARFNQGIHRLTGGLRNGPVAIHDRVE